jgi:lipopolysaccharide biosynthesis protein
MRELAGSGEPSQQSSPVNVSEPGSRMNAFWNIIRRILRRIAAGLGWIVTRIAAYAAFGIALLLPRHGLVIELHQGHRSISNAKRVAVFAHFDRRGKVHEYVHYYLRSLRLTGFDIVFVTSSPALESRALERLLPVCAAVLRRKNRGYDFGAYKDGLSLIGDLAALDELILANDSTYGPLQDLSGVVARCDASASVWGITDSWEKRYHLQSYFLLFKHEALIAPCMGEFWNAVRYVQSKEWVITKYEVGLTQTMLRSGLRCAPLNPYRSATAALADAVLGAALLDRKDLPIRHLQYVSDVFYAVERGRPLNSMHHFWDHLIIKMRCPFIKRDLLARNPARVPYVYRWENVIRQVSNYDTNLIVQHIQSSLRNRAV